MSCNYPDGGVYVASRLKFQSLSGFLMSCNAAIASVSGSEDRFQSLSGFLMSCNSDPGDPLRRSPGFQSLSGFLMSCNRAPMGGPPRAAPGFNPYRVF